MLEPRSSASGALSRSWELTRGSRWRIFGLGIILCLLLYIPVVAISGLLAVVLPRGAASRLRPGLHRRPSSRSRIGGLIQMFIYPLFYCVLTVAYYDLRVRKEGFDLELLASSLQTA